LVGDIDLFFEIVEQWIFVDRPPGAAVDRIERLGDLPARFLVLRRNWCVGPNIVGPDRAG